LHDVAGACLPQAHPHGGEGSPRAYGSREPAGHRSVSRPARAFAPGHAAAAAPGEAPRPRDPRAAALPDPSGSSGAAHSRAERADPAHPRAWPSYATDAPTDGARADADDLSGRSCAVARTLLVPKAPVRRTLYL